MRIAKQKDLWAAHTNHADLKKGKVKMSERGVEIVVTIKHKTEDLTFRGVLVDTLVDQGSLGWDPDNGTYEIMILPIELNLHISAGRGSWEIVNVENERL